MRKKNCIHKIVHGGLADNKLVVVRMFVGSTARNWDDLSYYSVLASNKLNNKKLRELYSGK